MKDFILVECYPSLFRKGGHCYEELMRTNAEETVKDFSHVRFPEFPSITFRYYPIAGNFKRS